MTEGRARKGKNLTTPSASPKEAAGDYLVIRLNWFRIILAAVIVFTVFTRLYGLSHKPYHHDESLYATYCWYLAEGRGYSYDPMMHGPFMFHLNALIFRIFGDSDFTARFSAALFGIALVCCAPLLKRQIGKTGSLAVAVIFAVSPIYMYFSRFLRHDIYFALFSFLVVAFFANFLATRKRWYLYAAAAAFALMFCVKENSYLLTFTFASFYGLMKLWERPVRVVVFAACYAAAGALVAVIFAGGTTYLIPLTLVWTYAFVPLYYLFERAKGGAPCPGSDVSPKAGSAALVFDSLICVAIFLAIFYFFFTTVFTNAPGFLDGLYRKSLGYWVHQDDIQRIKGPFTYFCPLAIVYELPIVVLVVCGAAALLWKNRLSRAVLIASSAVAVPLIAFWHRKLPVDPWDTQFHMTSTIHIVFAVYVGVLGLAVTLQYLREGRRFPAFISYWGWTSILIYSYAGEKVPWLLMHVLMPLIILAGLFIDEFSMSERLRRSPAILGLLLAAGLLLLLQASLRLSIFNEADPRERIVYTQTSTDITDSLETISELAEQTGQGLDFPVGVQGESTWPYSWYLRHYTNWFHPGAITSPSKAVFIVDWNKRGDYRNILDPNYVEKRVRLREWWVPEPVSRLKGSKLASWLKYYFQREPWNPNGMRDWEGRKTATGSQDIAFYLRKDLAGGKMGAPGASLPPPPSAQPTPRIPEKHAVVGPVKPLAAFGERGSAPGKLNEPRGIWADDKGNVYVADTKNHRWQKFDRKGNCLFTVGKEGSGEAEFKEPMGIAVDGDGNVYVADTWNHRIQKFDGGGRFLKLWPGGAGGFWAPKGMAFDSKGDLHVVDTGRHRVQKFSRDGKFLLSWGDRGEAPGQFSEPVGIAIKGDGVVRAADTEKGEEEVRGDVIYVADTANKRVQLFDTRGRFLGQFGVLGWEEYYTEPFLALDGKGNIWASDSRNNRVEIFAPDGTLLGLWSAKGFKPGSFNIPVGIFIRDGKVYIDDTHNHRVQVFDRKRVLRVP